MTAPLRSGEPIVVPVALGARAYDIVIGRGLIGSLGARITGAAPGRQGRDRHRRRRWRSIISRRPRPRSRLPASKRRGDRRAARRKLEKLRDASSSVCEALIAARIERSDLVVALGGGVVGDLAGFAASMRAPRPRLRAGADDACWRRSIPRSAARPRSTPRHGKNLIGAFYQPILVIADTALLDTLPRARVPRRLCRGGEIRPARRRRVLRLARGQLARCVRRRTGARARHRGRAAAPRPASSRATSARPATARCSISATPSATPSKPAAGFSDRLLHGEAVGARHGRWRSNSRRGAG